jgi:hypothetical protein
MHAFCAQLALLRNVLLLRDDETPNAFHPRYAHSKHTRMSASILATHTF